MSIARECATRTSDRRVSLFHPRFGRGDSEFCTLVRERERETRRERGRRVARRGGVNHTSRRSKCPRWALDGDDASRASVHSTVAGDCDRFVEEQVGRRRRGRPAT